MKTVFVSGCYDIIHGGHIDFFLQAKALGDHLTVCIANDDTLWRYKQRRPAIPIEHKAYVVKSLSMVDDVVIGDSTDDPGLDFSRHFIRLKPDILAVTEDDSFTTQKITLCERIGAQYVVLTKASTCAPISTREIRRRVSAPVEIPLRVDFAGAWTDVPKFARSDSYIVNCTISPFVSWREWPYEIGAGLGGSAAKEILNGLTGIDSELASGVGWQDPAVINETGLCVWKSGKRPSMDFKVAPGFLAGKMALLWTGKNHMTFTNTDKHRDYDLIAQAGRTARDAVLPDRISFSNLCAAVLMSYRAQIQEGMPELPMLGEMARKYCGGGHGGYVLYLFPDVETRNEVAARNNLTPIEPWMRLWQS